MQSVATRWRSLRLRLVSAIVAIPLLVGITLVGDVLFLLAIVVISLWALTEWFDLLERAGHRPFSALGLVAGTAILVGAYFGGSYEAPILAATGALALIGVGLRRQPHGTISDWSLTLAGVVYCALFLSYFVLLRRLPNGELWVILVLLGTFATDSAAFFIGGRYGTRQLSPEISPSKTVEGAVAGFIAAVATYGVLAYGGGLIDNWAHAVLLGAVAGIATQLGDLAESAFKRSLHAKDAGATIPGHGGMLDRLDSLVLAGVVVYYFIILLRIA